MVRSMTTHILIEEKIREEKGREEKRKEGKGRF